MFDTKYQKEELAKPPRNACLLDGDTEEFSIPLVTVSEKSSLILQKVFSGHRSVVAESSSLIVPNTDTSIKCKSISEISKLVGLDNNAFSTEFPVQSTQQCRSSENKQVEEGNAVYLEANKQQENSNKVQTCSLAIEGENPRNFQVSPKSRYRSTLVVQISEKKPYLFKNHQV